MSDLLKEFVRKELESQIKDHHPHLKYPCCMYALVTQITESPPEIYTCALKILDRNKNIDEQFPEIPLVQTTTYVEKGDIVVVVLLYGDMLPYIIGRADT